MSKFCMSCMEQYGDEFEVCPHCGYIEGTKEEDALHMVPGSILHERYIVGKSIGFGGFGVTYIGYDALLEHKVAIKEYMPSEFSTRAMGETEITVFGGKKEEQFHEGLTKFHDEAKRLAKFNRDDGIVKVYDTFEENNTAYIIMELLEGETLASYLEREKTVPVEQAIQFILPIAESLKAVHEAGIIHRDIAPDNIFLTKDGKVKLIDFGAARFATTSHSRSLSVLIKPGYSPEEQYRSRGDQGAYTDTYALGAVLYRMITGVIPPDALERRAFFENKKKDILVPISKYCKEIPEDRQNAILNAMNVRIEDRTQSADELIHELTTDEPVKRRKGKIKAIDYFSWPLWAKISIPSVAAMVITLGILFAMGVIGFRNDIQKNIYVPEGMSRVPSIVNTDMTDAEERLNAAVLLYSIVGKEYSSQIPADMILTQSVEGGSVVAENTIIDLVISGGAQTAEVPSVEGLYVDDAVAALENLGFLIHTETEYSGTVAEGGVISQSVKAMEEYPIGETIVLTISLGRDPDKEYEETLVTVPDFVGKTYDEALKLAQDAGLMVLAKEKAYSAEYEKDVIMFQSVDAGAQIISGNAVELTVSLGIQIIKVPDVQFRTEAEAIVLLENSSLVASITYETSETVKEGLVITQNPASGTETDPGAQVAIVISKGAASFAMPNVMGMSEAAAVEMLKQARISVTVDYAYSTAADLGKVVEQSIKADTQVYAGTEMTIVVSTGEELFAVPNVSGMSEADAINKLKESGFTQYKVNRGYSETVPEGSVISQIPDAGSQQSLTKEVVITVSLGKKPIEVPDVTEMGQALAESTLSACRFKYNIELKYDETIAAGAVISQDPKPGATAYSGDVITLFVSQGRKPITIPNVEGMSQSDATSTLKSAGFVVSVQKEYHDTVAEGDVIDQYPSSGTTAYKDSIVTIYVSKGKAPVAPTGVTLNYGSRTLYPSGNGTSVQLTATVLPSDATDKSVTWSSSNTSIAQVSSTGLVTAVAPGTATITVKTNTGGYKATCVITVETVAVSSISVKNTPNKTSYFVGDTLDKSGLTLTATYNNDTTKTITDTSVISCSPEILNTAGTQKITVTYAEKTTTFSVSVTALAVTDVSVTSLPNKTSYFIGDTLDKTGLKLHVTMNNGDTETITDTSMIDCSPGKLNTAGTQTITASYGGKSDTFSVSVETPKVSINSSSVSLYRGDSDTITASSNTGSISWSTSNSSVATVSNGTITAKDAGTAKITASITVNDITYTSSACTVTVTRPSISLSSYSGSGSQNVWDGTATTVSKQYGYVVPMPSVSCTPSCSVDWSVVSGDVVFLSGYDEMLIEQPGTVVVRASITYAGYTYSADYTYTLSLYKTTTDINYFYTVPGEPYGSSNNRYSFNVPNGVTLDATKIYTVGVPFESGFQAQCQVTYNGYTGWIIITYIK